MIPIIYLHIMSVLITVLLIALVFSVKELSGREWLLGALFLYLVHQNLSHFAYSSALWNLYEASHTIFMIAWVPFGIFILSHWSKDRMSIDPSRSLFKFEGRIPRSVFWIIFGLFTLTNTYNSLHPSAYSDNIIRTLITIIWSLFSIWIVLALYVKRLQDTGKSGWNVLWLFIPIIGALYLLAVCGFVPGEEKANYYGENPFKDSMMT